MGRDPDDIGYVAGEAMEECGKSSGCDPGGENVEGQVFANGAELNQVEEAEELGEDDEDDLGSGLEFVFDDRERGEEISHGFKDTIDDKFLLVGTGGWTGIQIELDLPDDERSYSRDAPSVNGMVAFLAGESASLPGIAEAL